MHFGVTAEWMPIKSLQSHSTSEIFFYRFQMIDKQLDHPLTGGQRVYCPLESSLLALLHFLCCNSAILIFLLLWKVAIQKNAKELLIRFAETGPHFHKWNFRSPFVLFYFRLILEIYVYRDLLCKNIQVFQNWMKFFLEIYRRPSQDDGVSF